jgi:septum formation protein
MDTVIESEEKELMLCKGHRVVLGSASPRREELLKLICPHFEIIPSRFDESTMPDTLSPAEHVVVSAREKARDVAAGVEGALVIGADTVVAIDEHILGKPENREDAMRMLKLLSGRTHQVYTGVHVVNTNPGAWREVGAFECTDVRFRKLSRSMIEKYVATGEPLDKAGAYAIQGRGSVLVQSISGCFFNVVGLPIYKLSLILEQFGVEALSEK